MNSVAKWSWGGSFNFQTKSRDERTRLLKIGMKTVLDKRGLSGLCQQHHPDQEGDVESVSTFLVFEVKILAKRPPPTSLD